MPKRYTALRVVATIYRILGWIIVVVGIIGSIAFGVLAGMGVEEYGEELGLGLGIGTTVAIIVGGVIGSLLSGLGLLALADLFYVHIDIEENTRRRIKPREPTE